MVTKEVVEGVAPAFTKPGWNFVNGLEWSHEFDELYLAIHPNHPTAYWMKEIKDDNIVISFFTDLDEPDENGIVWFEGPKAVADDPDDCDLMSAADYEVFKELAGKWIKYDGFENCHFFDAQTPDGDIWTVCVNYGPDGQPAFDDMRTANDRQVYLGPTLEYVEYNPSPELDGLEWRHEAVKPDGMEWIRVANAKTGKVYVERNMWESGNWLIHVIVDRYDDQGNFEMQIVHKVFGITG